MQGDFVLTSHCRLVKSACVSPSFERDSLEYLSVHLVSIDSPGQRDRPFLPLPGIELRECIGSRYLQRRLLRVRILRQSLRYRIIHCPQLLDPLFHHLAVAQVAKAAEHPLAFLAHLLPVRNRIYRQEHFAHRTAASQRDPQVVHRVRRKILLRLLGLFQDLLHPVAETSSVRFGGRGARGHGYAPRKRSNDVIENVLRCEGTMRCGGVDRRSVIFAASASAASTTDRLRYPPRASIPADIAPTVGVRV